MPRSRVRRAASSGHPFEVPDSPAGAAIPRRWIGTILQVHPFRAVAQKVNQIFEMKQNPQLFLSALVYLQDVVVCARELIPEAKGRAAHFRVNIMRAGLPVLATLFSVALAGIAPAATINLDAAHAATLGANIYTNGTESVAVSAVTLSGGVPIYTASWTGLGAGACSGYIVNGRLCRGDQAGLDGGWSVDGRGIAEMLMLDFGQQLVSITRLAFTKIEAGDDFVLHTFGNGAGTAATASTGLTSVFSAFAPTPFASLFGVAAPGQDDEWKLYSVDFEIAPVPLPATGLLLVGALGAMAAMRRRTRKAA